MNGLDCRGCWLLAANIAQIPEQFVEGEKDIIRYTVFLYLEP